MWSVVKYLAIVVAIVFGVKYFFGDHREEAMKKEYQAALKLFYDEQGRYPSSFEELERTKRPDGYPYIAANTNRDNPPRNGKWRVNEDRGLVYIERYTVDDHGRPIKDSEGELIFKNEY